MKNEVLSMNYIEEASFGRPISCFWNYEKYLNHYHMPGKETSIDGLNSVETAPTISKAGGRTFAMLHAPITLKVHIYIYSKYD